MFKTRHRKKLEFLKPGAEWTRIFNTRNEKSWILSNYVILHWGIEHFSFQFIFYSHRGISICIVMKFLTLSQYVLPICMLEKKIECDSVPKSVADCGPERFYSVHIPGCTGCLHIAKCGDQDACDVDRCKACGRCRLYTLNSSE